MTKKPFAAALLALALGSTAACGGGSFGGGGSDDGDIQVAVILPFTGASSVTANQSWNSANLAADAINKAGGIDGKNIELKKYDDQLTAEGASSAAQRAVTQDGVTAIIGGFGSAETLAIKEIVERSKVPFINAASVSPEVTQDATYTYRIAPVLADYGDAVIDTAVKLGLKDPALMTDSGLIGLAMNDSMPPYAQKVGLALNGDPIQYTYQATDMSAPVGVAAKRHPDGVLVGGAAGGDNGLIVKTLIEQGLNVPVVGFGPMLTADAVQAGGDAFGKSAGVYGVQDFDKNAADTKTFLAAYAAKYGADDDLSEHSAQSYDAVNVLADSLKKSKGAGGQALVDALNTVSDYDGVSGKDGATITFTKDEHDGHTGDYLVPYQVEDGKAVVADLG